MKTNPNDLVSNMTLRQHFSSVAAQGILANSDIRASNKEIAKVAVSIADELIEALNK